MAEVLVCAADRPVPDSAGRWYRGMPVVVKPDGWKWGRAEGPPKFVVFRYPNLSVEDLEELVEADKEVVDSAISADKDHLMYARRKIVFSGRGDVASGLVRQNGKVDFPARNKKAVTARAMAFARNTEKRPPIIIKMKEGEGVGRGSSR